MDHRLIERLVEAIAPPIKEQIAPLGERLQRLELRLTDIEKLEPVKGDKGDTGEKGEPGAAGEKGEAGQPGAPGDIALAPPEIAMHVADAARILAEAPPLMVATVKPVEVNVHVARPSDNGDGRKTFRFERDANNRIVAAHQEIEA